MKDLRDLTDLTIHDQMGTVTSVLMVQGYLTYRKMHPPRTLLWAYA